MAVEQEPAAVAEDILEHYGVKGMRWGVIRDHVFNQAGTKETSDAAQKIKDKNAHEKNRDTVKSKRLIDLNASKDHRQAAFVKKKAKMSGVSTLSNDDLNTLITRMNLEVQYKTLKTVQHEQSTIGKGKLWVGRFLTKVGGDILTDVTSSWLRRPGSRGRSRGPSHARAWVGEQPTIQGSYTQRAIGS